LISLFTKSCCQVGLKMQNPTVNFRIFTSNSKTMGCSSCSSGGGTPRGCKNNGTCSSGGCNKLGVFDWLANMQLPAGQTPYDILEIRFKNSRKTFYRNAKNLSLQVGDVVVVEASPGYDIGVVSVIGELARIQVKKKSPGLKPMETKKILRIANQDDIDKWVQARSLESEVMFQARTLAVNIGLEMKISDVEYQGDLTKATFYYTAEGRVDFRQLIKDMADQFKIRIEMRQIGSRQEAQRLGGIGSCGRELCCSTWLTDFRSVSTSAARYQQLSLNPQKLAGQCGKLKCCLNYELDMYLDAIKSFPSTDVKLQTEKGTAFHIKTDVFKRQLWYMYEGEASIGVGLVALTPERAQDIIKINKTGKKPADLKDFDSHVQIARKEPDYDNVVGQDSLNRFDNTFSKNKKRKKKKPSSGPRMEGEGANTAPKPVQKQDRPQGNKPQQDKAPQNRPQQNKPQQPKSVEGAEGNAPQAQANPNKKKNNRRRPPRKNTGGNEVTEK
jgi:cell fate regulator YaaT (PSP1 superfamily)